MAKKLRSFSTRLLDSGKRLLAALNPGVFGATALIGVGSVSAGVWREFGSGYGLIVFGGLVLLPVAVRMFSMTNKRQGS